MSREEAFHIGRFVQCDLCPKVWTDRTDSGGLFFRGKAICPDCAPEFEAYVHQRGEAKDILPCPPAKSFADFIRDDIRQGDDRFIISTLD